MRMVAFLTTHSRNSYNATALTRTSNSDNERYYRNITSTSSTHFLCLKSCCNIKVPDLYSGGVSSSNISHVAGQSNCDFETCGCNGSENVDFDHLGVDAVRCVLVM